VLEPLVEALVVPARVAIDRVCRPGLVEVLREQAFERFALCLGRHSDAPECAAVAESHRRERRLRRLGTGHCGERANTVREREAVAGRPAAPSLPGDAREPGRDVLACAGLEERVVDALPEVDLGAERARWDEDSAAVHLALANCGAGRPLVDSSGDRSLRRVDEPVPASFLCRRHVAVAGKRHPRSDERDEHRRGAGDEVSALEARVVRRLRFGQSEPIVRLPVERYKGSGPTLERGGESGFSHTPGARCG